MITGGLKSQIDRVWDAFWAGGIANPLEVIEQITYLLFIRRLDDIQTLAEGRARSSGHPIERFAFPAGNDEHGQPNADLRWSNFKNVGPTEMYRTVGERVFPFLRALGGEGTTYSQPMKDARFTIPTPALLAKVVDMRRVGRHRPVRVDVRSLPRPGGRNTAPCSLPDLRAQRPPRPGGLVSAVP
jgi:type I restriction enzyme M protein